MGWRVGVAISQDFTFWCANRYGRFSTGDSRKSVHTFNFGESSPEMTIVLLSSKRRLIHKVSEYRLEIRVS